MTTTLVVETVRYYPDCVKVYDTTRPSVWALFEVTSQGVRLMQTSCADGEKLADAGLRLAALSI